MGVSRRRCDLGVAHGPLHQFEVAGFAQKLGAEVVPQIVPAEVGYPGLLAQIAPMAFEPVVRNGMALALDATVARALCDKGENELGMMPLQRPKDFSERRCDRPGYQSPALAALSNLARIPIDLGPSEQAFVEPHSCCLREANERQIVIASRRLDSLGFVADQF